MIVNCFAIRNRLEELHLVNVSGISIKDWNNVLIHLSHTSHCKYGYISEYSIDYFYGHNRLFKLLDE